MKELLIGETAKNLIARLVGWVAGWWRKGEGLRLQDQRDIERVLEFREIASKVQAVYLAWPNWGQAEQLYDQYHPRLREIAAVFKDPQDPARMSLHEAMVAFNGAFAGCCTRFDPLMQAPHGERMREREGLRAAPTGPWSG